MINLCFYLTAELVLKQSTDACNRRSGCFIACPFKGITFKQLQWQTMGRSRIKTGPRANVKMKVGHLFMMILFQRPYHFHYLPYHFHHPKYADSTGVNKTLGHMPGIINLCVWATVVARPWGTIYINYSTNVILHKVHVYFKFH